MLNTLLNTLLAYPAKRYLVGFSGGRDSHVLLDLLYQLRNSNSLNVPIEAIHVNHNLNDHSLHWVEHCQCICEHYGVVLFVETIENAPKSGESIEAFAREARYELIKKHLSVGDIFLSAHHQRDQAETFLLQLMRGAGLDGLRAMPTKRHLGEGSYLRPLLSVPFADITAYANARALDFIEDDSNEDRRFDRNFIRHEILPLLERRFPQAVANIALSSHWLGEVPKIKAPGRLILSELQKDSLPHQKQAIRAFIKAKTGCALTQKQTHYLLTHHLKAKNDRHPVLTIGSVTIRRHAGELCVTKNLPQLPEVLKTISVGEKFNSPIARLQWEKGQGLLMMDQSLIAKPLKGSERFHPHTRKYATSVKKILNEEKIPVWLRSHYFGLYVDNELVAIPGVGVTKKHYQKSENAYLPLWIIDDKFVRI